MTVHEVHDDVRSVLDDAAHAVELPALLPLSRVAPMAERRTRRRQLVGGLATVLIVAIATIGVGLGLRDESPDAVFAGAIDEPLVPVVATAQADRFVGLAAIDPFALDDDGNMAVAVVTSSTGDTWTRVEDSPVLIANDAFLSHADDVFHMVGIRMAEVVDLDGETSLERVLVHARSADLVDWEETAHALPGEFAGDAFRSHVAGMAFVAGDPVVLLSHYSGSFDFGRDLEELGLDADNVCESTSWSNEINIRMCGETETIEISPTHPRPFLVHHDLAWLRGNTIVYEPIPVAAVERPSEPANYPATIYQAGEGIGVASRDVFESADGSTWAQLDVGREPMALVAARGDERMFRSVIDVRRYQTDDPVTGMGYSPDGGETWQDVRIDQLVVEEQAGPTTFSDLQSTSTGWVLVANRSFKNRPEVSGVERRPGGPSSFTVTVDGYELTGRTPYGAAELRDPTGQVIRSWDQLEVGNPIWSGLEVVDGDIVIRDDLGRHEVVVTGEQWNVLFSPLGPNRIDLLFSADGLEWQVVDSSSSFTQVLATNADGILVQRWPLGGYRRTLPAVELIPYPFAEDE